MQIFQCSQNIFIVISTNYSTWYKSFSVVQIIERIINPVQIIQSSQNTFNIVTANHSTF